MALSQFEVAVDGAAAQGTSVMDSVTRPKRPSEPSPRVSVRIANRRIAQVADAQSGAPGWVFEPGVLVTETLHSEDIDERESKKKCIVQAVDDDGPAWSGEHHEVEGGERVDEVHHSCVDTGQEDVISTLCRCRGRSDAS